MAVWVHDDDDLERARTEMDAYNANPVNPRYAQAAAIARERRESDEKKQRSLRRNYIDYRTRFASMAARPTPVTIALVMLCVLAAIATQFGEKRTGAMQWMLFGRLTESQEQALAQQQFKELVRSRYFSASPRARAFTLFPPGSEDVRHGQVWRLFSPMFIHYGILHFIFNMFCLVNLGGAVERRMGSWVLVGIVLLTSMLGNIAQFYWSGPSFGGMSGVVYGLFGFVWIKSIVQPSLGFHIDRNTVTIMLAWLVLCMTGMVGPIANAAHVVGLVIGMILAHAPVSWKKLMRAVSAPRG